ncbi:MAG: hypothetical protein HOA34_01100, partial [Flavobacterium sp.]|nr:hypothetical protein [Flavobacterium sp.]
MQATKLNKSHGASMFKAMSMALKPTEKLLQRQRILLTHLTRNSYKSAEDKLESGKAEKIKAAEEKKQTGFLYQLLEKNKVLENAGKNTMKFMGDHWKALIGLGLFLLPKSFWTGLYDMINKVILEVPNIIDSIKDGTFLEKYGKGIGETIGEALATYIAGAAFLKIVAPALGSIIVEALKYKLLKTSLTNTIRNSLPVNTGGGGGTRNLQSQQVGQKRKNLERMRGGLDRQAALDRVRGKPPKIPNSPSGFGKFGRLARLTGGAIGKIALPAGVAFALFDSQETFSEQGFQKGMAHAVESFTMGLLPREASEKVFKTVEDGVKKSATAVTKGFIAAADEISDGWSKLKNYDYNTLLDPIKKQIEDKKKKEDEKTKIPKTSSSLDLSDDAQKGRLKDKVAKAHQEMIAAKGSKEKAAAGKKWMAAKAELANYGKLVKKTGTRTKAPKFVGGTGTSKSGIQQLKDDEGFRSEVYDDTEGIKTIGFGFNLE